jgi:hypothetical protein
MCLYTSAQCTELFWASAAICQWSTAFCYVSKLVYWKLCSRVSTSEIQLVYMHRKGRKLLQGHNKKKKNGPYHHLVYISGYFLVVWLLAPSWWNLHPYPDRWRFTKLAPCCVCSQIINIGKQIGYLCLSSHNTDRSDWIFVCRNCLLTAFFCLVLLLCVCFFCQLWGHCPREYLSLLESCIEKTDR